MKMTWRSKSLWCLVIALVLSAIWSPDRDEMGRLFLTALVLGVPAFVVTMIEIEV